MTSQRQASVRHEVNETLRVWSGSPPGPAVTERTVPPAGAAAVVNLSAEAQAEAAGTSSEPGAPLAGAEALDDPASVEPRLAVLKCCSRR